jgi:hypothetical protein
MISHQPHDPEHKRVDRLVHRPAARARPIASHGVIPHELIDAGRLKLQAILAVVFHKEEEDLPEMGQDTLVIVLMAHELVVAEGCERDGVAAQLLDEVAGLDSARAVPARGGGHVELEAIDGGEECRRASEGAMDVLARGQEGQVGVRGPERILVLNLERDPTDDLDRAPVPHRRALCGGDSSHVVCVDGAEVREQETDGRMRATLGLLSNSELEAMDPRGQTCHPRGRAPQLRSLLLTSVARQLGGDLDVISPRGSLGGRSIECCSPRPYVLPACI